MNQFKTVIAFLLLAATPLMAADKRISELPALTNAGLATDDLFLIQDISAGTLGTKKISVSELDLRYSSALIGGSTPAAVGAATVLTNGSTSADTPSTIPRRDSASNFGLSAITFTQVATQACPSAGTNKVYGKNDGSLYIQDSACVETKIGANGGINNLTGDVTASGIGTVAATVAAVGGSTAANVHAAELLANAATAANTTGAILKRDGSGQVAATTFTGALTGNATTAGTATALASNPTDCGSNTFATTIDASGNLTCAAVGDAALSTSYLKADGSRGLSANWNAGAHDITATTFIGALTGNASTATSAGSATSFSGSLVGDVTGTQGATVVSTVAASTAANVHAAELLANAATAANTASAILKRDGSGQVAATTFTGALAGNATTATTAASTTSFSGNLVGDVTGTQSATVVSTVAASTAANVHAAELLANAATSANTASAIVKRDGSGNFTAGTITGNLTGNASGTAATITGSLTGDVTSTAMATTIAANAVTNAKAAQMATATFKGRTTAGTGNAEDMTATQATAMLNGMVGDTGSGGTKGLAPAPAAGDATRALSGAGTYIDTGNPNVLTDPNCEVATGPGWASYARATHVIATASAGNLVTDTAHGLLANTVVSVSVNVATGLGVGNYYIINPTTNTYQLATTPNGSAVTLTNGGSGQIVIGLPTDGAATGSPTVTFTRSVTSPIDGVASCVFTKTAVNSMGQGASRTFTIPNKLQGQFVEVSFDHHLSSGTYAPGSNNGDSDILAFIYGPTDGTPVLTPLSDSQLIPSAAQGRFQGRFQTASSGNAYRLILHSANSNAAAYTVQFDGFLVKKSEQIFGMAGSDWTPYTLSIGATTTAPTFGTITVNNAEWRRVGDSMEIQYSFVQTSGGSAGTGVYLFPLPTGYAIDTTKFDTTTSAATMSPIVGSGQAGNTNALDAGTVYMGQVGVRTSTNLYMTLKADGANTNMGFSAANAGFFSGAAHVNFFARVPIAGWTSQAPTQNSQTFKISTYLANGTRVTSLPMALGQYRSQLRNAGAATYTDTNGTPTALPNTADGIKLYGGVGFGSADTSNQPSRYEIFVGKNKPNVSVQFSASAGKTGYVNNGIFTLGTNSWGSPWSYDPTTGVVIVYVGIDGTATTSEFCGKSEAGANLSSLYFDITVSENALAVQSGAPVYLQYTGNGGTSVTGGATDITWSNKIVDSHSAWNGTAFQAPRSGMYRISGAAKVTVASTDNIQAYVGGVQRIVVSGDGSAGAHGIAGDIYLNIGELLTFRIDSTRTLSNSAVLHVITITSQGN